MTYNYPQGIPLSGDYKVWNAAWGNGLEIGFDLESSEAKNITFRDIDILHVECGALAFLSDVIHVLAGETERMDTKEDALSARKERGHPFCF